MSIKTKFTKIMQVFKSLNEEQSGRVVRGLEAARDKIEEFLSSFVEDETLVVRVAKFEPTKDDIKAAAWLAGWAVKMTPARKIRFRSTALVNRGEVVVGVESRVNGRLVSLGKLGVFGGLDDVAYFFGFEEPEETGDGVELPEEGLDVIDDVGHPFLEWGLDLANSSEVNTILRLEEKALAS
jgi:hypothetical protein